MSTTLVKSFTCLKGKPKSQQALTLLQRIASLVKPIMRKHNWTLPVLAEFFPQNDNLLGMNVNGGQKILIRLRPASAPDTFYEDEDLIGTMLHELTHNVHGPHDTKFYQFLSKLEQEYFELRASGYSGEGFLSEGSRLGTGVSHNVPPHVAKQKALEAAEKRKRMSAVLGGGGRLGGRSNTNSKSPRELAAEAAERRARDEKSCGTLHGDEIRKEVLKVMESDTIEVIDVDNDSPVTTQDKKRQRSPSAAIEPPCKREAKLGSKGKEAANTTTTVKPHAESKPDTWTCNICTLINEPMALQCGACSSIRSQDLSSTSICFNCGEDDNSQQFWTCKSCGELSGLTNIIDD